MPQIPRVVVPNYPHHIVQRGHDRKAVFVTKGDYEYYLANVSKYKEMLKCKIYGFCLMTNHVHLIVDPGDDTTSLGKLMKRVAARQTRYVNRLEARSGTLWESRYKSSPIDTEVYFLTCCAYVELNPVRGNVATRPEDYRWSSYRHKIGIEVIPWLDRDPLYGTLGRTAAECQTTYRRLVEGQVATAQTEVIRQAVQRGQLTGGRNFIDDIAARLGRRVEARPPGRPRQTCRSVRTRPAHE